MIGIITTIAWVMFFLNFFALIGVIGTAKFMFDSKLIWLRAILDPKATSKAIRRDAACAVRYAIITIVSAVVLVLLYL